MCYGLYLGLRNINFIFLVLNITSGTHVPNLIGQLVEKCRRERSTRRATSSLSSFARSLRRVQRTRASGPAILPITWHVGATNFKTSARRSVGRCARLSHAPAAAPFVSYTVVLSAARSSPATHHARSREVKRAAVV